ncbi:RTA1 like protein-domain-containing protein [Xylogone sp. PMI_703]|nr:RTA1 like protein-domain-containing protein [Xylogone sp. PMI_703]
MAASTCPNPTLNTPGTIWSFCASLPASYVFVAAFSLTSIAHILQALLYRKTYCWVIIVSALWQVATYVLRILSIHNAASEGLYAGWFVMIMVAPLWTNGFVYMIMGRLVWNFSERPRVMGVNAWRFGLYFVAADIITFLIQVIGAANAAKNNEPADQILHAIHVYMVGVGIQECFILVFAAFAIRFHYTLVRARNIERKGDAIQLLYAMYIVLILITIRIIFRLIEYSSGIHSSIPNHEVFQDCLDSLPMFLALFIFNVVHPGRIMPGKESDLPSRRERKKGGITSKADRMHPVISM